MGAAAIPYLIYAGAQIASSALAARATGAGRPESFAGTGADPVDWLTDVRGSLNSALSGARDRANEPVEVGGNMPLNPMPSFSGGGLPMRIGSPNQLPARVRLEGFGLGPLGDLGGDNGGAYRGPSGVETNNAGQTTGAVFRSGVPINPAERNQPKPEGPVHRSGVPIPTRRSTETTASSSSGPSRVGITPTGNSRAGTPIPPRTQGLAAAQLLLQALQGG